MMNIISLRKPLKAIFLGLFALTACTTQEGDGLLFEPGEQPLTLNAVVDSPASTRQTTFGTFESNVEIAIAIGNDVRPHIKGSGSTLVHAPSTTVFSWSSTTETKPIKGWYPYNNGSVPSSWTVPSLQNTETELNKGDLLYAPETNITYANRASTILNFYHQTCMVEIKVMFNSIISSKSQISSISIGENNLALTATYAAPTTAGQKIGTWTPLASSNAAVTPFYIDDGSITYAYYEALLIPQNMTSKPFIVIRLTNGKTLRYTPQGTAGVLAGGKKYTYTVTPKYSTLEVSSPEAAAWGNETGVDITSKQILSEYTADQLKMGDFFYRKSDGTWATSDGGLRAVYYDGTFTRTDMKPDPSKGTLLGVVFCAGRAPAGDYGDDCYYYNKAGTTNIGGYGTINGYVMGINNYPNRVYWASATTSSLSMGYTNLLTEEKFRGYDYTKKIKEEANDPNYTYNLSVDFPQLYYAIDWKEANGAAAPSNSTGWFLPARGQLGFIYSFRERLLPSLKAATGNDSYGWERWYWSSCVLSPTQAIYVSFETGNPTASGKSIDTNFILPCLVF